MLMLARIFIMKTILITLDNLVISLIKLLIIGTTNDPMFSSQLFGLCSSCSFETVTMSKGGCS